MPSDEIAGMTASTATLSRRIAHRLGHLACVVMPESQRHWADAMRCELLHVPGNWEAMRWALGCLAAAHLQRIRAVRLMDAPAMRAAAALLVVFRAFDALLPTIGTIAYRLSAKGMMEAVVAIVPGGDFQRLVPLVDAIPLWLHVLCLIAAGLYLAAARRLIKDHASACVLIAFGVGAEMAASNLGRGIAMEVGVVVVPNPSILAAVILPVVLPVLVALAAWSSWRRPDSAPPAQA